eukprot:gene4112-29709_t
MEVCGANDLTTDAVAELHRLHATIGAKKREVAQVQHLLDSAPGSTRRNRGVHGTLERLRKELLGAEERYRAAHCAVSAHEPQHHRGVTGGDTAAPARRRVEESTDRHTGPPVDIPGHVAVQLTRRP